MFKFSFSVHVICISLIWALIWHLNSVSATCWGSLKWQEPLCELKFQLWKEIPLRPPQTEKLLILVFTSASFWGCLSDDKFSISYDSIKAEITSAAERWVLHGSIEENSSQRVHTRSYLDNVFGHYYYSKRTTDFDCLCSKCFLLGSFYEPPIFNSVSSMFHWNPQ